MVDGVKGVDRAVLIRTSMGASRRSVKKRQVLSQSLAVQPSILSAARARAGGIDRSKLNSTGDKTAIALIVADNRGREAGLTRWD